MFSEAYIPYAVWVIVVVLFIGILGTIEIGRYFGRRRRRLDPDSEYAGVATVESAVFALLGLLLAFTFAGAVSRFDARRDLITRETNTIGTAYLRLDLLPADHQPELRRAFAEYLEARLKTPVHWRWEAHEETGRLQQRIWQLVTAALAAHTGAPIVQPVLDPVNAMIDMTTTRWMSARTHPPKIVYLMLFVTTLASGLLAGYAMSGAPRRRPLHAVVMALVLSSSIYVTLDVEFPRLGFVRIDSADEVMQGLLDRVKRDVERAPPAP